MSNAIQQLEDLMRRHREEGRAVQYLDLVSVLAALKAERDELLGALNDAKSYIQGGSCGEGDAEASQLSERVYALIAKHAGSAS